MSDTTLYDNAVKVVREANRASTSFLQRKLRLDYNTAAELVVRLENNGIVTKPNHGGDRSVMPIFAEESSKMGGSKVNYSLDPVEEAKRDFIKSCLDNISILFLPGE